MIEQEVDYSRDWTFADEPCSYRDCQLPLRTHVHYSKGPADPWHVVFLDEGET